MKLTSFNIIDRSKHFDAIAINKKLDIETVTDKVTGLRFFIVKNVLENPDQFVELMQKHNAYGGDVEVTTPGYRQMISALEIPTLSKLYAQVFKEFTGVDTKLSSWYYTANIYHPDMMTKNRNNYPRFEPYPVASTLCLTKDSKAGISFFKLKLDGKENFRYNDDIKELSDDNFKKAFPVYSGNNGEEPRPWVNFEVNDEWEMYAFENFTYNSAIIYDPLYFNQVTFDGGKVESVEYALSGFLDAPIVKFPFWSSDENKFDKDAEKQ